MLKLVVLSPSEAMLLVCGAATEGRASSTLADSMGGGLEIKACSRAEH